MYDFMDVFFFAWQFCFFLDSSTLRACQSFSFYASFISQIPLDADYSRNLWAIFRFFLSCLEAEKIKLKVGVSLGAANDHCIQELGDHWPLESYMKRFLRISFH